MGNARVVRKGLKHSNMYGTSGPYLEAGPLPAHDHCGYEVALQLIAESREQGRYSNSHKQWDTIRALRTAYSNQARTSREASMFPISMETQEGKRHTRLARDGSASPWFVRFMQGCKNRMGQDVRPNLGMDVVLMCRLLKQCSANALEAKSNQRRFDWILTGCYFACSYIASLRGPEGRLLDLEAMVHYNRNKPEHTVLALRGKIKGEHRSRTHLLPCAHKTLSGINLNRWVRLALGVHRVQGRKEGPLVCDGNGVVLSSAILDHRLHQALKQIYLRESQLFPLSITKKEDIQQKYHCFRTFKRTSNTRATNMKIDSAHVNVVNRWRQVEKAGVKQANLPMDQHYAQIEELSDSFEAYTSQM